MAAYKKAIALAEAALTVNPRDTDARISAAAYYAKSGDRTNALAALRRLPTDITDPHVLVFGAGVYADLGDRGTALAWLERAAQHGLAKRELEDWIELDVLKSEPRFKTLLSN